MAIHRSLDSYLDLPYCILEQRSDTNDNTARIAIE